MLSTHLLRLENETIQHKLELDLLTTPFNSSERDNINKQLKSLGKEIQIDETRERTKLHKMLFNKYEFLDDEYLNTASYVIDELYPAMFTHLFNHVILGFNIEFNSSYYPDDDLNIKFIENIAVGCEIIHLEHEIGDYISKPENLDSGLIIEMMRFIIDEFEQDVCRRPILDRVQISLRILHHWLPHLNSPLLNHGRLLSDHQLAFWTTSST